ncbi:MAG: RND family efflux transporter MFP subunit [Gammaproteobacteria bacterium]|jgi:RND family efflux transporter MFP subunit
MKRRVPHLFDMGFVDYGCRLNCGRAHSSDDAWSSDPRIWAFPADFTEIINTDRDMFRKSTPLRYVAAVSLAAASLALTPRLGAAQEPLEARDCVIVPHRVVDVSSAVAGLLESVSIERSDSVVRGQELARLESAAERASQELADAWASIRSEIALESINRELDNRRMQRVARLYNNNAAALDDKDQSETDASLARVRLHQAREKRWIRELDAKKAAVLLERRTVRSPVDGVVVERFRSGGEYVENQPIVRIAQLDPLQVETILPMHRFGSVRAGMQASVRAEHDPEATLTATVSVVDRVGDAASGTFGVRLSLPNPGHRIPAGVKCTLNILPAPAMAQSTGPLKTTETQEPADSPNANSMLTAELDDASGSLLSLPETPATLEPLIYATPSLAVTQTSHVEPLSCVNIGPFNTEHSARLLQRRFATDGNAASVHSNRIQIDAAYIVVSEPPPDGGSGGDHSGDNSGGAHHVERMREAGVSDLLLMRKGDFSGLVSLGIYNFASAAERRRAAVAALGFDSEVRTRNRNHSRWRVTLNSTTRLAAGTIARSALDEFPHMSNAVIESCNQTAQVFADEGTGNGAELRSLVETDATPRFAAH